MARRGGRVEVALAGPSLILIAFWISRPDAERFAIPCTEAVSGAIVTAVGAALVPTVFFFGPDGTGMASLNVGAFMLRLRAGPCNCARVIADLTGER
tara:strand:- start:5730 stop:6020 length:291 start_codon:yes stop_codon:yes gene_type:complete